MYHIEFFSYFEWQTGKGDKKQPYFIYPPPVESKIEGSSFPELDNGMYSKVKLNRIYSVILRKARKLNKFVYFFIKNEMR